MDVQILRYGINSLGGCNNRDESFYDDYDLTKCCSLAANAGADCDSCLSGYQVSGVICTDQCADLNCASCIGNPKICLQCKDGFWLKKSSTSTTCEPCHKKCETCKFATKCIKCAAKKII